MTALPPSPSERSFIPELDGLRFFSFFLVFLFHGGAPQVVPLINSTAQLAGMTSSRPRPIGTPSIGEIVVGNGWIGVEIFFVLSGYLITRVLLREESLHGRISLRAFYIRRALRIWPLYYLTVVLTFFALPFLMGDLGRESHRILLRDHLLPFLLFAGNWSMGILGPPAYDSVSVMWSLCVEEQFYLVGPLLFLFVGKRWRIPVCLAFASLGLAWRYWATGQLEAARITPVFFQYATPTHLDSILVGMILSLLGDRRSSWLQVASWLSPFALMGILFRSGVARGTAIERSISFLLIGLVAAGLIQLASSRRGLFCTILRYHIFVWLGKISFGLYMLHEIAFSVQHSLFNWIGWFPGIDLFSSIARFSLTVLFASLSYKYFEHPFLRLKEKFVRTN